MSRIVYSKQQTLRAAWISILNSYLEIILENLFDFSSGWLLPGLDVFILTLQMEETYFECLKIPVSWTHIF